MPHHLRNTTPHPVAGNDAPERDAGLTLVEIVLAVVISMLIGGVIVATLNTSLTAADRTSASITNSVDEQLITAFLARDAQAAGGIDPLTTGLIASLGVSTVDDPAGWAGCTQSADLAVRFAWVDRSAIASSQVVVTYALHADGRFVRRACEGGLSTESVLAGNVTAVDVTCEPLGCTGLPAAVALTVRGGPAGSPFEVAVRASLRAEFQTAPDLTNATQVPLLVTGTSSCPVLSQNGTGGVHVLGGLVVADGCGLAPIAGDLTTLVVAESTVLLDGIADPLTELSPPATCPSGPTRSAAPAVGSSTAPDAVTVHTEPVTITSAVTFQPGRHVFCGGLTIGAGASVSGTGVLVFVPNGGLTIASGATVSLSPATTGPYAAVSAWVAGTAEVSITSGATVHDLRGTVYVPDARVRLTSTSGIRLGALVADRVTLAGTGPIRFGQPSPTLTVASTQLPEATSLQPYTAASPSVSGGTAPLRYQATGLPVGLVISSSGAITGTPVAGGTSTVSLLVIDATGASVAFTRTLTVADPVPVTSRVVATGGDTTATVSWAVSSGSPVVSTTVTATATGQPTRTCTATGASTTCNLTGLTNGITYTVSVSATNSIGTGAPATTSVVARPAVLVGAGSQLWLDAMDPDADGIAEGASERCNTSTDCTATGNVLTRWEDKSGANNDAIQTTAAMAGTYVQTMPAVDFDANGFYEATVSSGPDLTLFVVAQSDTSTWNTNGWLLSSRVPNGFILHPSQGRSVVEWYATNSAGTYLSPSETPVGTITAPHIYDHTQAGSNAIVATSSLDGNTFGVLVHTGQTRTTSTLRVSLGSDQAAGRFGDGKYREVIVFSRALSTTERRSIQEYLARKWGVAITPSAPTAVSALAANGGALVSWTAPTWNGGSAITGYRVTAWPGGATCTANASTTSCAVLGLTNGTAYAFFGEAINAVGTGAQSAQSNTITPGPPPAATSPVAVIGSRQATIAWTAPALNGHAPLTGYTVAATASGQTTQTCTATPPATTCTVTGLTNEVSYTFAVVATNAHGNSPSVTTTATPMWRPAGLGSALTWWFDASAPNSLTGSWVTRTEVTVSGAAGSTRITASSGVVERVDVTNGGSGYTSSPTLTISGGGGSGAFAGDLTVNAGTVTLPYLWVRGSGYTSEPTVTASGGGGSGATLRARIIVPIAVGTTIRINGATHTVVDRDGLTLTISPALAAAATSVPIDEWEVSNWDNLAPNTLPDARQATAVARPALGTMSGRPAVVFSGFDEFLAVLQAGDAPFDKGTSWTVLAAYQSDRQVSWGSVAQEWSARNTRVVATAGAGLIDWQSAENVEILAWLDDDSLNGGPVRVGVDWGYDGDTFDWTRMNIGGLAAESRTGGWDFAGAIGEIIVVNGGLDSSAVADATAYLTAKWNQPAVVPSAPINVTAVPADGSAVVSWRAANRYLSPITGSTVTATAIGQTTRTCTTAGTSCTLTNLVNGVPYTVTVTSTNATGTGPASVAVTVVTRPALLTGTNSRMWLDGADIDGDGRIEGGAIEDGVVGGRVTTWIDKSGRANHTSAPTDADRPRATTQAMNGLPVITFNGLTVLRGATAANPYSITTDRTMFVVTRRRSGFPTRLIDRTPEDNPLFNLTWDNRLEVRDDAGGQYRAGIGTSSSVEGRTSVVSAHRSGTALGVWVNGVQTGTATITGNQTQRAITIARHPVYGEASDLDVAEVILFNRALTAAERRQVEEYLRRKWGAVIIPDAPTGVTASRTNGPVTVTWTAPSDGGSPITGSTVTASNGATCTTTTTSCTFSGLTAGSYTFTVRSTNAAGTGAASSTSNTVSWTAGLTATITTAKPWDGVLHSGQIWVTNQGSATISRIDIASDRVVTTVAVGSEPRAITSDGTTLWVANYASNNVTRVDPVTNRVVATIAVGQNPSGIASDGKFVWVASAGADRLTKIDTSTNTVVANVSISKPTEVAVAFGSVWVTTDESRVVRVNPNTNAVIANINAGDDPTGIISDGTSIWVANFDRDTITRINPNTNAVTATVTVGDAPTDFALIAGQLWVTVGATDSIVAIDPTAATIVRTMRTGRGPIGIVADAASASLWVMNFGGDSVSRFSV